MADRVVILQNPARLSTRDEQLVIYKEDTQSLLPLSDIACLLLEHPQISLSTPLLEKCSQHSVVIFACDSKHIPCGVFLPFNTHSTLRTKIQQQLSFPTISAGSVWKRIISVKILNQSSVLKNFELLQVAEELMEYSNTIRNHDPDNREAVAAKKYFASLFGQAFVRSKSSPINSALNYGYALLRGMIARQVVASGFQPVLGIHHCSQYNQFNLCDDLIEPFRPLVDQRVKHLSPFLEEITPSVKKELLCIFEEKISIKGKNFSLPDAIRLFVEDLSRCYASKSSMLTALPLLSVNKI